MSIVDGHISHLTTINIGDAYPQEIFYDPKVRVNVMSRTKQITSLPSSP
jgi:hypothetical protein